MITKLTAFRPTAIIAEAAPSATAICDLWRGCASPLALNVDLAVALAVSQKPIKRPSAPHAPLCDSSVTMGSTPLVISLSSSSALIMP